MNSVFDILEERGFIADCTDDGLRERLANEKMTIYVGFDPTADSLHLGHMVPVLALSHYQRAGHKVITLVGGATGMVGDPSGKNEERNLLTTDQVAANAAALKAQLGAFLDFDGDNPAIMLDNLDWIGKMSFIDWLRDVGKYFNINHMLAKESVKVRVASASGITFTEFSYMTMQAYDFLYLYDNYGCTIQGGGNDQWGNITAGTDLVRKARGGSAYGITNPLLTTASGDKFGKSAGNAIWLDPERTSPYKYYQYWINTDDRDVEKYLKLFTMMEIDEIAKVIADHVKDPGRRTAQKRLAEESTRMIHGEEGLEKAFKASKVLFGGEIDKMADRELSDIFADVPSVELKRSELEGSISAIELLVAAGVCKSKGEARRDIKGGGVYLNNVRITDLERTLSSHDLVTETMVVLRKGKKNYRLVRFV